MNKTRKKIAPNKCITPFIEPKSPSLKPNAETKKAIKDIKKNKNLTRYRHVNDFWTDMGLDPNA